MSHLSAIFQNCPNVYAGLMDVFGTCPPNGALSEQIPHAEFLTSPANRNGLSTTIHPSDNKVRKVTVAYQQRPQESEVTEGAVACEGTTKRGYSYTEYDIDTSLTLTYDGFIESTDLERNCENSTQYFLQQLAAGLDTFERAVATRLSTQSVGLTGTWGNASIQPGVTINGSEELVVNTLKAGSTDIEPATFQKVRNAVARASYCNPYLVVGGNTLFEYTQMMQHGCCANQGLDLGSIFAQWGFAAAYDRRTATALGSENKSLVLMTGAQQVLHFIRGNWVEGGALPFMPGADFAKGVFLMPRLGLPLDVRMKYVCSEGVDGISFVYSGVYKVVGMPTDMFHPGDIFDGIVYANKILVTNV